VSDYPSRLDARVLLTLLLAQFDPLRGRPLDEVMDLLGQIDEADAEYFCMQCVTQRVTITRGDAPGMAENWLRAVEADPDSAERETHLPAAQSVYALAHGDTAEFSRARRELLTQFDAEHASVFALPWTALMIGQTALADTLTQVDLAALDYPEDEYEGVLLFMDNVRGRWSDAGERVGHSFDLDPDASLLSWVSGWALNVPLEARVNGLEAARARCLAWDGQVSRLDDAAWQALAPHTRLLGAALMSLQADDSPRALALADSLDTLSTDSTYLPAVRNAVRLIRGEAAHRAGDHAAAVEILEELEWEMSPSAALVNFSFGVSRAQLVLAEAAWRTGDEATSRRWLEDGLTSWQVADYALREMRRGQVNEELGDLEQARIHYARVVEALEPADDELAPRREEAQARLVALMAGEG
jgi:tetratricopeptide (TPR) repeat protein